MKYHQKKYENVFSTDRPKSNTALVIDDVFVGDLDLNEYVLLFKNHLNDFYLELFNNCVKLSWLRRKFGYKGTQIETPLNKNNFALDLAFVKFVRRVVGRDLQIITRSKFLNKWEGAYFDAFFPIFMENNPFEDPDYYRYPYKNISPEFLVVVYQLDDRFDLLEKADKDNMTYGKFTDYVINHVLCENDDLGYQRYVMKKNRNESFFIIDTSKISKKENGT
jgi:hypothetical protein